MDKVFKVFVDFDGTITKEDVGDALFRKFGEEESVKETLDLLLSGKITAKESWLRMCEAVKNPDPEEILKFIMSMEIEKEFIDFVQYCKEHNFDLYILSDGFDYYIHKLFEKYNLKDLTIYCNKLDVTKEKLAPSFPYLDIEFPTSANCKKNHILSLSSDDDYTIFVGDGNSDKYAAIFCDFIFAKKDLRRFCEIEKVTYFPFDNFHDVMKRINTFKDKKRLKKRHQATLKRREAYMAE